MNFSSHDWLWLASLALGALIAWQNKNISLGIANLRSEMIERIAKTEGDVKVLQATAGRARSAEQPPIMHLDV